MNKLEYYQWFFSDQLQQTEIEQKSIVMTPVARLLANGDVTMGYVDHIVSGNGHVVLKFPKGYSPRLKVLKYVVVVKKNAFATFGNRIKDWRCSLIDFRKDPTMHTVGSDIVPLFFVPSSDGYEYLECSNISIKLFELLKSALALGKQLTVLISDPFPPIDYFVNLKHYMDLYPDNEELMLEPNMQYEDWHPKELSFDSENPDAISNTILDTLEENNRCILQGPPGTGKSYVIATVIAAYLKEGKTVCATTMANKGLMELILQSPLKEALETEKISKTNLSADESKKATRLKATSNGLLVPKGELICATNYVLSSAFSTKSIDSGIIPHYDLVVIEEASQAFLTALLAFKSLGERCLIVGDPMQLPPVVKSLKKPQYKLFNANNQVNGMSTYALATDTPSFRIITSHRLTPASASLTGLFYDNHLTSVNRERPIFSNIKGTFISPDGGVIYEITHDCRSLLCSVSAIDIIRDILNEFKKSYPNAEVAVIAPFKDTVKELQKNFQTANALRNLTIETIDRIQGMTVDYTILYIPAWKPAFALEERRFNVATSRSRGTTLLLSDMPLENFHSTPAIVQQFLKKCLKKSSLGTEESTKNFSERDKIKMYYPGMENIVDELLDNNVEFNYDGECDLTDTNDEVIASAGMVLKNFKLAIDPINEDSKAVFHKAGYKVISSKDFNINMVK